MKFKEYASIKKQEIKEMDVKERSLNVHVNKNFIVSIIGPRRAGKTFFLYDFIKKNKISEEDYCFVNFEEPVDVENPEKIPFLHQEIYGKLPEYLFFDEIQELPNWEKVVYHLYEKKKFYIFITGSSSKLLSKEIATQLRGRSLSYLLLPFSFREVLSVSDIDVKNVYNLYDVSKIKNLLDKILVRGTFPDVVLGNIKPSIFFREWFSLIVFKDIVERYEIRKRYELEFFLKNVVSSFTKEFSVNKLYNTLGSRGIKTSKTTLYSFQKVVEDALFAFFLKKIEKSLRRTELTLPKVYLIDTGLPVYFEGRVDKGRLMENLVFLELVKSGLEPNLNLFYFKDYQQREVDFVIKQGLRVKQLIQVTYASSLDEIDRREIKSLIKAAEIFKKDKPELLVITWDLEDEIVKDNKKIKLLPLWKWLLTNNQKLSDSLRRIN